jgi:hypothetical protein
MTKAMGSYLGRRVWISEANALPDCLSDSLLMLVLSPGFGAEATRRLLTQLALRAPLGISLFGHGAGIWFHELVNTLSVHPELRHVMASVEEAPEPSEAIEEFLHSRWPSEDRFDEWTGYGIVVTGSADLRDEIERASKVVLTAK